MRSFRIFCVFAVLLLSLVLTVSAVDTPVSLEVVSDSVSDYFEGMCFDPSTLSLRVDYGSGVVGLSSSSCDVRLFGKYSGGGLVSIVGLPYQSSSLVYDGTAKVPVFADFDADELTVSGVVGAVNAGTYTALFKPKPGYQWSDGSTIAKSGSWSIEKATGSLELSATSVEVNKGETTSFTVNRVGDDAISAESSDTSVATVSVSGNTVTVTGVSNGNAIITVSVAECTNHAAPTSKTVATTVVTPLPTVGATLESCSWEQIRAISDAGLGSTYFSVGDSKTFTISGTVGATTYTNQSMKAVIIGFDHNSALEGTNRIHFLISATGADGLVGLVDSSYGSTTGFTGKYTMNTKQTNSGGWASSHMRNTVLGSGSSPTSPVANTLLAALPTDLRAMMKATTKYSDNSANGTNNSVSVTATTDYLFLLAEYEVRGAHSFANSNEQSYQEQYEYFKSFSKVAYRSDDTYAASYWWLRSAQSNYQTSFCVVTDSGGYQRASARDSLALLAGFTI